MSEFKRWLAEAIAWCAGRASVVDPAQSLRAPSLQPSGIGEKADGWLSDPWARVLRYREEQRAFAHQVRVLADARARLLQSENCAPVSPVEHLAGGRLLVYYPDATVSDGFSGTESRGFFDVDDAPPWDTWLCYVRERESPTNRSYDTYLVSWVPPAMIELAERGISVNPMDCICWADLLDEPFIEQLRAQGLLR